MWTGEVGAKHVLEGETDMSHINMDGDGELRLLSYAIVPPCSS